MRILNFKIISEPLSFRYFYLGLMPGQAHVQSVPSLSFDDLNETYDMSLIVGVSTISHNSGWY